jgi:thermitase
MKCLFAAAGLLLGALSWPAPGALLRIEGDLLSLQAEQEPVRDVLAAFARQGVRVRLDPAVTGTVTLAVTRLDAEKVLRTLLTDCDYLAVWKQVKGPLGPIPVLEELQVYKPGRKEAAQALAPPSGLSTNRMRLREFMAGELLLRVKPGASADRFLALIARFGGRVAGSQPALGLYKIAFPPDSDIPRLARELAQDDLIASAEPNYVYRLPQPGALPSAGPGAPALRPAAGQAAAGGPVVAVLDTGFGNTGDPLISWLDVAGDSAAPVDLNGHGTQMGLLAEGRIQPYGAASATDPLLPVLSIRIAGQGNFVASDTLLDSLQAALSGNVRVVSLSWGSDMDSLYMKDLLGQATRQGIVVVAAAGNTPTGQPVYPAAFPNVLAVGAAGADGKPASWSNFGDFVSLTAPGYAPIPGTSTMAAGTSVSTAYAAHILGLYFQRHPEATAEQAIKAVQAAVTGGTSGWDTRYGAGLLDQAAVQRLLNPD